MTCPVLLITDIRLHVACLPTAVNAIYFIDSTYIGWVVQPRLFTILVQEWVIDLQSSTGSSLCYLQNGKQDKEIDSMIQ